MADGQPQTLKEPSKALLKRSKNWFKKALSRPHNHNRPLITPQPSASASGQENRDAIVQSGLQSIAPIPGAAAALSQQDHPTVAQLSTPRPSFSSSSGVPGSAVDHDQHDAATEHGAASGIFPSQPHEPVRITHILSELQANPEKTSSRALSTAKDVASFTGMLLKRVPDAIDSNPAKIAFGIVKIVLQIKDEVKSNIDTVDQRILSTVDQISNVEGALAGWNPNNAEETRAIELYRTTLGKEWKNLNELKKQSLIRKIAVHEEDKGKIADIFDRINHAREQLVLVTGLRVHKTVLAIQKGVAELLLQRLEVSHAADHKSELEGEKRQVLRRAVCTPGTRVRILRDIARWANNVSSESQSVYWLSGEAGTGKSTIAYTIARRFEFAGDAEDKIVLGGNFFCSRQMDETKSATRIIRTIVYHLALRCKSFADALNDCGDFNTVHQSARAQLEGLLIKPWEQARNAGVSQPLNFLVVIDALDEIDGRGGSEFLRDLLDSINKHRLQGLKFFVTSRPDPDLVAHLESFDDKQLCRLGQVPIEEADADIRAYLNANLGHFAGGPEMDKIVAQAAGLFIYAATVVKYVEDYAPVEYEERLDTLFVSDSDNPEESSTLLDSLYYQVLLDGQRRFKSRHYLDILHTFICTAERTSTSVVAGLRIPSKLTSLALQSDYTEIADGVLKSLHAVLYIQNDQVFSYHKSFTDFIFDEKRAKKFWCDYAKYHQILTESCFRVMDGLRFNIASITSSFLLDRDNSALPNAVKQKIAPVLSYSCRSWDYHLSAVTSTGTDALKLRDTLSRFLQLRVLFWIEVMNLLGSRGQCDRMLQRARKWVTNDNLALQQDFAEVAAFALYFSGSEAALSTPHLYISALATWPRDSGLCQEWRKHFHGIPKFTNALLGNGPLMTLAVGSRVNGVAYSNNGMRIVSGSGDKLVRVWDASTGETLNVLEGHTGSVTSVAVSRDDTQIVSGSYDKAVRVWDASTGKMLMVLEGHTDGVTSVAISSDGMCIVSSSNDKSVRVWDASTGDMLTLLEGHTDRVTSVSFSSDNTRIISGSEDNSVRVWCASTGEMLKVLEGHTGYVTSIAFSSDDTRNISGSADKLVRVWDASSGEMLKVLEGHTNAVLSVAFSSDDTRIVSGSVDQSVRVWDASTGEMLQVLEGHTSFVTLVAFSSDAMHIVSSSADQSVRVWDASTGKIPKALEGHTLFITSVAISSDAICIVSSSADGSVRIRDTSTGETQKVLEGHTSYVASVAFSSDDTHIISGSHDKSIRVWDASTGETLKVLEGHTDRVSSVAYSSHDTQIVSGSHDKAVWLWDASTGGTLKVLDGHTDAVLSVAFSKDDTRIVSSSVDKEIRLWDAATGQILQVLEGHAFYVTSVAFSSNALRIVSGSGDYSARVWDASTGKILKILEGHTSDVSSVSFSSDDKYIVSSSFDDSIRLWDASTGKMLKVLEGHTGRVRSVAFSSDDTRVVSGSQDRSVRVWELTSGEILKTLKRHIHTPATSSAVDQLGSVAAGSNDNSAHVSGPRIQQTSLRYVRQKTVDEQSHTGWLLSPDEGKYLMFVPVSARLPDTSNILTMPPSRAASVDFTSSTLGSEWVNCFSS